MSLTAVPCLELKYGIRNKDADSREGGHLCRHPVSTDINGATWDSKCQEKKRRREKGGKNQSKSQGCETLMLLSRLFLGKKKKKKKQRNKHTQDFLGRNGEQQGAETITKP